MTPPSTHYPPPTPLSPDDLDDLIYFARANDLPSLRESLTTLSSTHKVSPSSILASAIDADSDGLGSRCCLLHWPAANGHVEVLEFLLSLLGPDKGLEGGVDGRSEEQEQKQMQRSVLVNHRNVNGNTPLHWATLNARLECVKLLVEAGADPTLVNEVGHDALFEAEVGGKEGSEVVVKWLLENCKELEGGVGANDGAGGEGKGEGDDEEEVEGEVADVNGKIEDGGERKSENGIPGKTEAGQD